LEILSFLHEKHLEGEILYGNPLQIRTKIQNILLLKEAQEKLSKSRLGVIGEPSDWLISSSLNFAQAKAVFGVEFVKIPFSELQAEIEKKSYPKEAIPSEVFARAKDPKVLQGALEIYGALKRIVAKYDLAGFSIRCFDLLGIYKNTSCLALALLNSEGISAGCEGDEASLLSMHLLRCLNHPSFQCNPSVVDESENSVILAHCTLPLCMVGTSYSFLSHFESDLGIGIRGTFKKGPVTLFKLSSDLKNYHLFRGEIVENLTRENLCRSQIKVQLSSSVSPLLENPYGNHLLLCYDDLSGLLQELLARFGL
jgi:L-fucose isomerase-like protein